MKKTTTEELHELTFHIETDSSEQATKTEFPSILRESLTYFKNKTSGIHGIKINYASRSGNRTAWLNPYYLLEKDTPLESSEMKTALTSLGLPLNKVRIKEIHCSSLGFQKSFRPSQKLDATFLEEMALLSGMLVVLEEQGQTEMFRDKIKQENVQELSEIIQLYESMEIETQQDIAPEEDVVMSLEMG